MYIYPSKAYIQSQKNILHRKWKTNLYENAIGNSSFRLNQKEDSP